MNEKAFELKAAGTLSLKTTTPTLAQIEEFCAEARRLGLGDAAPLRMFRQGILGPQVGWHFDIPVEPKKV